MKRFLSVILSVLLLLSLSACSILPKTTDNPNIITVTDSEGNVSKVEYIPDPDAKTTEELNAEIMASGVPLQEMQELLQNSADVLKPYKLTVKEVAEQHWVKHDDSEDSEYISMFKASDDTLYFMWFDGELHVSIMENKEE